MAVSLYGLALAAIAAAVFVTSVHATAPLAEPHLQWWVIAAGWVVAEACVVHLKFRRSAHSFSLADIPFVFGLLFAGGDDFLAGALIGAAIAYACRRLPPIKLAFNLAQLALAVCVAVVIVRALAIPADALEPATWLGMYLATLVTGALTIACIAGAIAITEGGMSVRTLGRMFAMDGVVTATNSSIAIAAAIVVATDPRAVPVLLVPALSVFVLYRAYIAERQRHEQLEFLYEANRALSRSPEVAEAIEGLLAKSLEAFRSEIAEVVLFGADGTTLRTTHGPADERATMVEANREASDELASLVDRDTPVAALVQPIEHAPLRAYLEQRRIRNAMVAMLPGENRMIGTIMLANRFGIERGYGPEDLRLLEALANNASVALQYDRLEQAVIRLRTLQEQLQHQAYHDPLTDLPNRSLFMDRVKQELAGDTGVIAVLFIDVDDFKVVNDSLGHTTGDALLVSVAGRLRHSVRPQDLVARLGGDEFAVMLPALDDAEAQANRVASRILEAFDRPVQAGSELLSVHLSVGITDSGSSGGADELIRDADLAMYQAKSKGKGRFEFFERPMAAAMLRRHDLKEDLAKAIAREEIIVEYQPIVSLESGRISAAEVLVRWDHPARGRVPPSEFIPLAENTGLIRAVGRHVLGEACRQARRWEEEGGTEPLRMHVNLSVVELRDPELVADVLAELHETGLAPGQLVLEITETQLLRDAADSAARFHELRSLGVRVALDDFGTGYSSLSYLHALPLDTLKIAKPFVDGLGDGGRNAGFIAMIIDLARTLELDVIAEGIETAGQLAALRELGAELGQGYLLGRPSAASNGRPQRGRAVVV
ncbi:MAG: EAL domain-containing protein [Actinomycetota bacterium]|nr:EAL domain-containing protein [Actinomycetota bacterium]